MPETTTRHQDAALCRVRQHPTQHCHRRDELQRLAKATPPVDGRGQGYHI